MNFRLFLLSFSVVFLAELGDKTQLAALSLSTSGKGGIWSVFIGSSLALVCSTAIACLCASFLDRFISPKVLNIGSSVLFILIGVYSLSKLAWSSSEFDKHEKPAEIVSPAEPQQ